MPPHQDNARFVFLVILLFWIVTNPDSSPGLVAAPSLTRARLARQRHALNILNSTQWEDFSPKLADEQPGNEPKYLNLTGFREEDGFAWADLGRFRNRCEEWSQNAVGVSTATEPVWQNVTGIVRGPWIRKKTSVAKYHTSYNLSALTPNVEWVGSAADWSRNVTGSEGKMMLRVEDDEQGGTEPEDLTRNGILPVVVQAREVSATVTIDDDEGSGSSIDMRLHGVHWPSQGVLLLTTTSEKFAGIFGLPHLTSRKSFFESSRALLNRTLDRVLQKRDSRTFTDPSNPWTSSIDAPGESWNPTPHCEYVMYVQVHPPDREILKVQPTLTGPENVAKAIGEIEDELRFPKGAPLQGRPVLQMSAVVFSPDCAFFLETKGQPDYAEVDGKHLVGWKQEFWLHSVSTWLLGFALVIFAQVQLLKMQVRETSTPSTLGRISFYTGSIILLADGITFAGSAAWSLSATTTLLPSLVVTCASFLSMTVSVAFLAEIYKVQEPEWRRGERERQATSSTNPPRPAATPGDRGSNTLLGTASRRANPRLPSPPIIIPSDQDIDAEIAGNATLPAPAIAANSAGTQPNTISSLSSIFGRFIILGISLLFLTLAAITWRPPIRSAYFNILGLAYLSLWVPQIYRNMHRNCRRALSWRFVVGQSVLRLAPIAYFYTIKGNFAFSAPDWTAFAILAGWVWIQVWVLAAQNVLGPRFGIPKGWMPEAWEYHPVLREDNVEAGGLPIGLVLASAPGSPTLERTRSGEERKNSRLHIIDCAICRETLEVPVIKAGVDDPTAGGVSGVFARRAYMVTPCRHIFHSACLEGWMRFRLQCPICRENLPPL